jgi:hypothetical protein
MKAGHWRGRRIDFAQVNRATLAELPRLLQRWLPGGRIEGTEYVVRNPKRDDRRQGSFKVNLDTGQWADFALEGARGRDLVSLAAYLGGIGQVEALIEQRLAREALDGFRDRIAKQAAATPLPVDIEVQLRSYLARHPSLAWDDALARIIGGQNGLDVVV